jgi:alkylation response protein AidB-like acyl-CoA dehydrogenase
MNKTFFTSAAAISLFAVPVFAQTLPPSGARPGNEIGTGQSLPLSSNASNISGATSLIAPRLPEPPISEDAPPSAFLDVARRALAAGRTGEAQEALERAESRALIRDVSPSRAGIASEQPLVRVITSARMALGSGDRAESIRLIESALKM